MDNRNVLDLPSHCYSCGAFLKGGATEHKPGCEVLQIIEDAWTSAVPPEKAQVEEQEQEQLGAMKILFEVGRVEMTPGAVECLQRHREDPASLLRRHQTGDFGYMDQHDKAVVWNAIDTGQRVLSVWKLDERGEDTLYIITEADRQNTTFMRCDEY